MQNLKALLDAVSALEAEPPEAPSGEEAFERVPAEEADGEFVTPEVIEEDSEAAQQMMLNSFLRFMHFRSQEKR